MRKIFKNMAWTMAATLVMAACSDSLDESSGNGNSNEFIGDKGYVNIGINLPTTASTRANDNFHDGVEDEYKVNNVIIALFYGDSEESATCKWAFRLTSADFNLTSTGNITSLYASGVRMIEAPEANEKVYALAIVNPTEYFNVSTATNGANDENSGDKVLSTILQTRKSNGEYASFTSNLSTLNAVSSISSITDVIGTNKDNFLMTNAPIANQTTYVYNSKPTDFKVTTLAPITVYNDKSVAANEAIHNPIYVERAVAKTQVKVAGSNATLTVESDIPTYDGASVLFKGWKLQTTNNYYYPVRKVDDWNNWSTFKPTTSPTYDSNRFFGSQSGPFRTYWGIDPNYSTDIAVSGSAPQNYNIQKTDNSTWNTIGDNSTTSDVEYSLENTTTAQTMENERLTSVLLKTIFTPTNLGTTGTSFFMINNTSAIYTENDFFLMASAALPDNEKLTPGESLSVKAASGMTADDVNDIKALLQITSTEGSTQDLTDMQAQGILAAAPVIKYYKEGVTYYYATVIRHFDDTETPLGDNVSINTAEDYSEPNHLGRYGVVRNNWYELEIKSVSGMGEPEIPEDGGGVNPPDKTASYINCQINVLSWAKRSQGVDL